MRRFRFRLEKLLDLRAFKEREAEIFLAGKTAKVVEIQARLEAIAQGEVEARASRAGSLPIQELRSIEFYLRRLERDRERALEELAKAELEREAAQKAYLEAHTKTKVLDKLKERREGEYYRMMENQDAAALDEIANGMAARKAVAASQAVALGAQEL
jgi:flagellar protein FliJ